MTEEQVVQQFKAFLTDRIPDATSIDIRNVRPIFGGASRETFAMEMEIARETSKETRRVILRREFSSGIIETETRTEWEAYRAFFNTEVPVPELIWLEEDPKWMGSPFFVMEEIIDCQSSVQAIPTDELKAKVGKQFCEIMGTVPIIDTKAVGLEDKLDTPAPDECWKRELDYWEADINEKELEPHPLVRAAIRWLRKYPPPPAQKVVIVHGDMRTGNFMFNEQGEIKAILDWEMMHMGDPLEDLTWALNRLWSRPEPDKLGGIILREQAIKIWEETSGFKADPEALFWWEVFTSIKGMGIWISMNKVYDTSENTEGIVVYGGTMAHDIQSRILIEQMKEVI